ncbi:MAG: phenylacetic acid degradation protein PaaD [Saprospiraceae bacterium]|nr:MAG: phenylacetic acid degradation protein PaaD [Saprospiraceae bacterium]
MTTKNKAQAIIEKMYNKDTFSQWLGINILEVTPGGCIIEMKIKANMLNGLGMAHGGITFSLSDSAFAFASNSRGRKAVSIETSISHTKAVKEGDQLTAIARELNLGNRIAVYEVSVRNQHQEIVGLFKGTVFRTETDWDV